MYDYSDTASIDARLEADVLKHQKDVEKTFIVYLILVIVIFKGWFCYWLKFGIAVPSKFNAKPVDIQSEPIQINYTKKEKKNKMFLYQSFINKNKILIMPQAHYEMSGTTVAFNHSFVFTFSYFDSAALYDLGTAWGKMGNKRFYNKYYNSYSQKNELRGSRILWTQAKTNPPALPWEYSTSHFSHSHIVPANRNIMAALLKIKKWDRIKIEGDLVDMSYEDKHYHTSMSRNDSGYGDRGNGSCETIYVTKVQIGRRVYE